VGDEICKHILQEKFKEEKTMKTQSQVESKDYIGLTEFINTVKKTWSFIKMGDFFEQLDYSILYLLQYLVLQYLHP
jgi:hypothetical protein